MKKRFLKANLDDLIFHSHIKKLNRGEAYDKRGAEWPS